MTTHETSIGEIDGIAPEISEFFEDYGQAAVDAYGSTRLFHASHTMFLETVCSEGLREDAEIIDPKDIRFITDAFQKNGVQHPQYKQMFNNYILGKPWEDNVQAAGRGVYFSSIPEDHHTDDIIETTGYGIPERLVFLVQNLNYIAVNNIGDEGESNKAASIRDKYTESLLSDKPAIVLLEADPFAPDVINDRLAYIDTYRGLAEADLLTALKYCDGDVLNIAGPISASSLAFADAKYVDTKKLQRRLFSPSPDIQFFA